MYRSIQGHGSHGLALINVGLLVAFGVWPADGMAGDMAVPADKDYAFSLYGGRLTDSNWYESLTGKADFVDSRLLVGALGWTFRRAEDRAWSLELEGNIAKHYGLQDHWEFNALVSGRWHRFPWSEKVATSVAFGVGPSYASEMPVAEVIDHGSSDKLLVYWQLELTLGPPKRDWAALLRLHHRSTAYGLMSETGGANALTAGLRFYF